ncbi:MAG: ABC transporter permease [Halobacteriovoraceae bacterium]|nr:ABC transporter permease [Halobacteriovoraceae bacterium]
MELYKSRILFNVLILGFILSLITYIASEFTYGTPERVAIDFGLGLTNLSILGISIFMGVTLISQEIESRTVYMILSRPVSRFSFLLGRILGMSGIFLINIAILGCLSCFYYILLGGTFSSLLVWTLFFMFLEAGIMLVVVILLSLISNTIITVIFSITIYVGSHAIAPALGTSFVKMRPGIGSLLNTYAFIFPDFSKLNIKNFVIYQQALDSKLLISSLGYGFFYFSLLVIIASYIFKHKNLD